MTATKKQDRPGRGRPRSFDVDQAVATAQRLFHEKGYDAVGVAALTEALGIAPPSFYAAFGSKAGLFERVLDRYASDAVPMDALFRPGRPPAEAVAALLEAAAQIYAADPGAAGCLVIEAARSCGDSTSAATARSIAAAGRQRIRDFIAATHPEQADAVADLVVVTMSGMSAAARQGWPADRLVRVARHASAAIPEALGDALAGGDVPI